MAIAELTLVGVKSLLDERLIFKGGKNILKAGNGVGKSSIADGLSFLYTGKDRRGNAKPLHLISKGMKALEVKVLTDKGVVLSRTLTEKGSSTLKITRNGISNTLNQSAFSGLVGQQNTFLSAMLPGYFMKLTPPQKKDVLREVTPQVDHYAVLDELLGRSAKKQQPNLDLSKKSTITAVTEQRRHYFKSITMLEGELGHLKSLKEPTLPSIDSAVLLEVTKLEKELEEAKEAHANYQAYDERQEQIVIEKHRNKTKEKTLADSRERLDFLKKEPFADATRPTELDSSFDSKRVAPAKPLCVGGVSMDSCPSCGQTVSKKLAESTKASNELAMRNYREELNLYLEEEEEKKNFLAHIEVLRVKYVKELSTLQEKKLDNKKEQETLTKLIKTITESSPTPLEPLEPVEFSKGEVDTTRLQRLKEEISAHEKSMVIFNSDMRKFGETGKKIEAVEVQILSGKANMVSLEELEKALKELPNALLDRSKDSLSIDGLDIDTSEGGFNVSQKGIPYTALSTGQSMRVDIKISKKINDGMKNSINIMFIDDSELMDEVPDLTGQYFLAVVDSNFNEVEVVND